MQASASPAAWASSGLRRLGRAVVDGVLPPRCLACGETVGEPDALCGRCWSGITFFAPPWCAACGLPFPHPMGEDAVCADCARERRSWDRARAVLRYDKHSRRLVLGLEAWRPDPCGSRLRALDAPRRRARSSPAPIFWSRCRCIGRGCFSGATIRRRCWRRRSARPAARRSRRTGWCAAAARRRKAISGRRRASAMCAAPLPSRAGPQLCRQAGGRSSTTCMTTGATVEECARVLKRAGAASVGVLTLARALRVGG